MNKRRTKPTFKPYDPDQLCVLHPSSDEMIPKNHVVKIVRDVIDELSLIQY